MFKLCWWYEIYSLIKKKYDNTFWHTYFSNISYLLVCVVVNIACSKFLGKMVQCFMLRNKKKMDVPINISMSLPATRRWRGINKEKFSNLFNSMGTLRSGMAMSLTEIRCSASFPKRFSISCLAGLKRSCCKHFKKIEITYRIYNVSKMFLCSYQRSLKYNRYLE